MSNLIPEMTTAAQCFTRQKELIVKVYKSYNRRNMPDVLSAMQPDVVWPNGWENGYIRGHDELSCYWKRQWKLVDSRIEPLRFMVLDNGRLEVKVRQIVKDLKGFLIFDGISKHIFSFKDGLIEKMEIGATG